MPKTEDNKKINSSSPLSDAPPHIQLAVDLIMILESHQIEPDVALEALEIVKLDLEYKLKEKNTA
ncbi:DUF2496 domain-containing protein [Psychrosphaera ytuae]|uniref:DUF2496 domain-containing protein n=1 Tax=Psychrosphaera ytuae TaxID=2820710 RepID=A0A975DEQ4_9GAMM|nr:DUF2496 domain-containing protein [Psychrosphaera ytuae]QTH65289.1 DUF2496 domain-containing protein [Psychrosphaera ytuae]